MPTRSIRTREPSWRRCRFQTRRDAGGRCCREARCRMPCTRRPDVGFIRGVPSRCLPAGGKAGTSSTSSSCGGFPPKLRQPRPPWAPLRNGRRRVRDADPGALAVQVRAIVGDVESPMTQAIEAVEVEEEGLVVRFRPPAPLEPKEVEGRLVECLLY